MSRANLPAAPTQWQPVASTAGTANGTTYMTGLSIREHFAAMAIQGLLANTNGPAMDLSWETLAEEAVAAADALLLALAKPVTP